LIAVTGANGYLGGRILSHLRAAGQEVVALVRRPQELQSPARPYAMGEPLAAGVLDGVQAVVHAAWDLSARGKRVHAVNVEGSLPLLEGLAARDGRLLAVSSLAAFDGARSDYGRAKLALERAALERGGLVVRPGLVFGVGAGGLFGQMVRSVSGRGLVPLVGGSQRLFVTHDERLCELAAALLRDAAASPSAPVFAAHEQPTTLRAIAHELAEARGSGLRTLPLPAGPVYAAVRAGEALHLPLPFRSDSVRSLTNPAPLDQIAALERSTISFPPLRRDLWAG
jgi:nucleoside-diphosphate-sugar epimerase